MRFRFDVTGKRPNAPLLVYNLQHLPSKFILGDIVTSFVIGDNYAAFMQKASDMAWYVQSLAKRGFVLPSFSPQPYFGCYQPVKNL